MSRNQPLGPLQGFGAPQQTDLMRQLMEPAAMPPAPLPIAPRNVKSALKEFTSDLMFTLSQSLAASASAPGGRGTALGIAAAIAGPSQRRMLVQQAEDEKAAAAAAAEKAAAELEQTRAQTKKLETENWKLRNPPTEFGPITLPDGSVINGPIGPGTQIKPPTMPESIEVEQTLEDGSTVKILTPKVMGMVTSVKAAEMKDDPAIIQTLKSIYGAERYNAMSEDERIKAVERVSAAMQPFGLDLSERMALQPPPADPNARPATADETKALGFYMRLSKVAPIMDELEPEIGKLSRLEQQRLKRAPNELQTELGQRFHQTAGEFINAALRRESGAAISESEYERFYRIYFPQPGDSPATLKQKKDSRKGITEELQIAAGNALRQQNPGGGPSDPLGIR